MSTERIFTNFFVVLCYDNIRVNDMKYTRFIVLGLLLIVSGFAFLLREQLVILYTEHFIKVDKDVKLEGHNNYYRNYGYSFVENTNNFQPHSKQDLIDIYYTIINAGKEEFTFYCPDDWKECLSEVKYLANDQTTLSHINNFVHPFNGFKHIETVYDSLGKITIRIDKTYSKSDIKSVQEKVEHIKEILQNDSLSTIEQIKVYHDYIINNSKYDSSRSDENIVKYKSDIAYGPLIEGKGLCGGYTDAMALLLEDMSLNNIKVSSENHVWNAVLIDNQWYHLDLTWDDPVTTDGSDLLEYNFFLINTQKLNEIEKEQHIFSENVYQELK